MRGPMSHEERKYHLRSREKRNAGGGAPWTMVSFDYPPSDGGISRLCSEIVSGVRRFGSKCDVVTQARVRSNECATADPEEVRVPGRRPWREIRAWYEMSRINGTGPVVCGTWYPEGLLAVLAGVRSLVVLAHGVEFLPTPSRLRRRLWRELCRYVCDKAALVVANSEYTRKLVQQVAPKARVRTIPLGVDIVRFSPHDRDTPRAKQRFGADGKIVVSTVSRLHKYKGHETVLRSIAGMPGELREKAVYLIAGRGPHLEDLRVLARELKVEKQVRYLGFVPEADLPDLYRASDLFVLCTREAGGDHGIEGFGLVFLEAQACGTPVVGTRTGGIPDAVKVGHGGWLIAEDDVEGLTRHLCELVEDPEKFRSNGKLARQRVEEEATWGHYLEHFSTTLKQERLWHD